MRRSEKNRIMKEIMDDPELSARLGIPVSGMANYFAAWLLKVRLETGLTQAAIADRAGLAQGSISRIEEGYGARLETLESLLLVFGYEVKLVKIKP